MSRSIQSILLISPLLLGFVFSTGCAHRAPRPMDLQFTRDAGLAGDEIVIDVIGVSETEREKLVDAFQHGTYFSTGGYRETLFRSTPRRGESIRFSSGDPLRTKAVKRDDVVWRTWKDFDSRYIALVANMRVTTDSKIDPRLKFIPYDKKKLSSEIRRQRRINVALSPQGITCSPPVD